MRLTGDRARVRVPATSANLGPGFDSFGLALDLWDDVRVRAVTGASSASVTGEGAGVVPTDGDHLVLRALRAALDYVDAPQAGLVLECHNRIPHGRGLGSSAAATIAGLVLARGLISDPEALDDAALLTLATEFEGHADNAAPALHGGATIAFVEDGVARAARIEGAASLRPVVLVPSRRLATRRARGALPDQVPHADAAFTAARAGLLALALGGRHDLLFTATQDRLHQHYRRDVMPATLALLERLRAAGSAAVVSGAGPSIVVLDGFTAEARSMVDPDWQVHPIAVASSGAVTGSE
ncbi:homoserine kinase [Pseudactinotalea sp. HY160]|uniref:homoserine kinase n=1 Tax=Pseudactinotalea sp. HY160 TaxID=2654490 RepID=UPI00128B61BE|nr:homoserine kinase [Pseudactinotalea sp. HY160]MPV48906.1 homoserine kinase [Pseudactinotalea sp. HY160]